MTPTPLVGGPYVTRVPIRLRDGTQIPTGAHLIITWSRTASTHGATWVDGPTPDRVLVLPGLTLGRALAGSVPSDAQVQAWVFDGVCETPRGDTVEPDGFGPDRCPSWLWLLGIE